MNKLRKVIITGAAALPVVIGAQVTNAALIEEWGYTVNNQFENVTFDLGTGPAVTGEGTNELVWGSGPESKVTISTGLTSESGLVTGGGPVAGGTFTHINRSIDVTDTALTGFDLISSLTLTPYAPTPGSAFTLPAITFASFFTETPNQGGCFGGAESNCDDIFSLSDASFGFVNDNRNFVFQAESFTIDDYSYTVLLEVVGLGPLTPEQCNWAGAPGTCIGFITEEGNRSSFESNFRIVATAIPVPEPGTLALLGLGLLGLAVSQRRSDPA